MTIYTVDVCGDILEVFWNGSVFVGHCGQQFSRKEDAMRSEILAHYSAGGEEITEEGIQDILSTFRKVEPQEKGV